MTDAEYVLKYTERIIDNLNHRFKSMKNHNDHMASYFEASLRGELEDYDFEEAFEDFAPHFAQKAIEHAQGTLEEFIELMNDTSDAENELKNIPGLTWTNDYMWFDATQAADAIWTAMYNMARETFDCSHSEFQDIRLRLEDPPSDFQECVVLMEEAIHAEHVHGRVLEIYPYDNPDEIREEVEADILEELDGDWKNLHADNRSARLSYAEIQQSSNFI